MRERRCRRRWRRRGLCGSVSPPGCSRPINVTPLVDVVLVLLIIFMVMAPKMGKGTGVNLRTRRSRQEQGDERGKILVDRRTEGCDRRSADRRRTLRRRPARRGGRRAEPQGRDPGDARSTSASPAGHGAIQRPASRGWAGREARRRHGEGRLTSCSSWSGIRLRPAVRDQHHAARRRGARSPDHLHGRRSPSPAGLRRRHPRTAADAAARASEELQAVLSGRARGLPHPRASVGGRAPRRLPRDAERAGDPGHRSARARGGDPRRPPAGSARAVLALTTV